MIASPVDQSQELSDSDLPSRSSAVDSSVLIDVESYETGSAYGDLTYCPYGAIEVSNDNYAGHGEAAGWARFNTSEIPDGSVVTGVTFYFYPYDWDGFGPHVNFTGLAHDPTTSSCPQRFSDITTGVVYVPNQWVIGTGWRYIELGAQAAQDLEDQLVDDWFAVGIDHQFGIDNWFLAQGWQDSEDPYIVVTYQGPTPPDPDLLSVSGIPSSILSGQPFSVTVTAENDGGTSTEGSITVSVLFSDEGGELAISGASSSEGTPTVYAPGEGTLYDSTCTNIGPASHHFIEAVDTNWVNDETNTLSFTVTPQRSGDLWVRVRTTMKEADPCVYLNDISVAGGVIDTDQQGWQVRRFSVDVQNTQPPAPVFQSGTPIVLYPETYPAPASGPYSITVDYTDPNGQADLDNVYLQLDNGVNEQTMMWILSEPSPVQWAGEGDHLQSLTATKVNITDGWRVTWIFQLDGLWTPSQQIDYDAWGYDGTEGTHRVIDRNATYDNGLTIQDAWSADPIDQDGDGYARSIRIYLDADTAVASRQVYAILYTTPDQTSGANVVANTGLFTIQSSDPGDAAYIEVSGLPHGLHDFAWELYDEWDNFVANLWFNVDPEISEVAMETDLEDTPPTQVFFDDFDYQDTRRLEEFEWRVIRGTSSPPGGSLENAMDASQTEMILEQAGFSDGYTVQVEDELMLVVAGGGTDTLTVQRGYEGSTPAAHPANSAVLSIYPADNVTLEDDAVAGSRVVRLAADRDPLYRNSRIETSIRFLEGTYAALVQFDDSPRLFEETNVQTFYLINSETGIDYSEVDFEYLAWNTWASCAQSPTTDAARLWMVTWEYETGSSVCPGDPPGERLRYDYIGNLGGYWILLVMQVEEDEVRYYVNGELQPIHGEPYTPETDMQMALANWTQQAGLVSGVATYQFKIDWALHASGSILTPTEVDQLVSSYRSSGILRKDWIPQLSVGDFDFDFGDVVVGESADAVLTVSNIGGGVLTGNAAVSAPFSVISGSSYSLVEGETHDVVVRFSPTSETSYSKDLTFTGAKGGTTALTGTGVPEPCIPPVITVEPADDTIESGESTFLTVDATGTEPLSYQWFLGTSGSTSDPIPGADQPVYITGPLLATTQYWVRVSNACGQADSRTATITVTDPCIPPDIDVQPQSQTIGSGDSAELSVGATGTTPFEYQWYEGLSGDTGQPLAGATGSSFTSPPLFEDTQYWVQVTNPCGSDDSETAFVTVSECVGSGSQGIDVLYPSNGAIEIPLTPEFSWLCVFQSDHYEVELYDDGWYLACTSDSTACSPSVPLEPSMEYELRVFAFDSWGSPLNDSPISLFTTVAAGDHLFSDGFESGTTSRWSESTQSANRLAVQAGPESSFGQPIQLDRTRENE